MENEYDHLFKYILIGESGVGKTSLIARFCDEIYTNSYTATIGVDFKIKTVEVNNRFIKLQIWDTAGQERFKTITTSYYRGAHCIIVVFDLTNLESFEKIENWLKEVRKHAKEDAQILILGNKVDDTARREVDRSLVEEYLMAENIPIGHYFEVSASENIEVNQAFVKIAYTLVDKVTTNHDESEEEFEFNKNKGRFCC
ncbi:Ras-related protein Rab-1A [Cucumispora dikerogammari]|nr:Ras-related protein Rab-1A [Cucumispora dikerogammari]